MKENYIPLNMLPMGCYGKVKELVVEGPVRRRMMDLGLIMDTVVEAIRKSPSGDPTAYQIRGAVIALREEEASKIMIEPLSAI